MLSPVKTNLGEKPKNRAYRVKFFRGRAQDELAFQLRAARKRRKLTQPELEKLSGMKQSAISRLEQASYSHWNFQSLLCLADAMDLRVKVVLDYAEDVIREYEQNEVAVKTPVYFASRDNKMAFRNSIYQQVVVRGDAWMLNYDSGLSTTRTVRENG
jgi:transcriptional regulator with XRE-family HTH domain